MDNNNYCVGCSCYYQHADEGYYYCNLGRVNSSGQCPCSMCIIKPMCQQACPAFHAFEETSKEKGLIRHELLNYKRIKYNDQICYL